MNGKVKKVLDGDKSISGILKKYYDELNEREEEKGVPITYFYNPKKREFNEVVNILLLLKSTKNKEETFYYRDVFGKNQGVTFKGYNVVQANEYLVEQKFTHHDSKNKYKAKEIHEEFILNSPTFKQIYYFNRFLIIEDTKKHLFCGMTDLEIKRLYNYLFEKFNKQKKQKTIFFGELKDNNFFKVLDELRKQYPEHTEKYFLRKRYDF